MLRKLIHSLGAQHLGLPARSFQAEGIARCLRATVQSAASGPAVQGRTLILDAFLRPAGCWQCLLLTDMKHSMYLYCEPGCSCLQSDAACPAQVDVAVGNFEIADLLVGTVCPEHGYLARSTEAPAIVGGDEFFAPEAELQRGGSIDSR